MADEPETAERGSSRRTFIKRSLVAGAVVWSAPAITSMPAGRAWAKTYHTCTCTSSAYGLRVIIPILSIDQTFGVDGCVVGPFTVGSAGVATVTASAVCGNDTSGTNVNCAAQATIASLDVLVGSVTTLTPNGTLHLQATVLEADASSVCGQCVSPTGSSTAATASVAGTALGAAHSGGVTINVDAGCNTDVLGLGLVKVNEQVCNADDSLSVNALHIRVPATGTPIVEVIASHAQAGSSHSDGRICPCVTCGAA